MSSGKTRTRYSRPPTTRTAVPKPINRCLTRRIRFRYPNSMRRRLGDDRLLGLDELEELEGALDAAGAGVQPVERAARIEQGDPLLSRQAADEAPDVVLQVVVDGQRVTERAERDQHLEIADDARPTSSAAGRGSCRGCRPPASNTGSRRVERGRAPPPSSGAGRRPCRTGTPGGRGSAASGWSPMSVAGPGASQRMSSRTADSTSPRKSSQL